MLQNGEQVNLVDFSELKKRHNKAKSLITNRRVRNKRIMRSLVEITCFASKLSKLYSCLQTADRLPTSQTGTRRTSRTRCTRPRCSTRATRATRWRAWTRARAWRTAPGAALSPPAPSSVRDGEMRFYFQIQTARRSRCKLHT